MPRRAGRPGTGLVHAPGRSFPPRVPPSEGTGQHPRRHRPARCRHRDHPATGAPLRGRRGHLVLDIVVPVHAIGFGVDVAPASVPSWSTPSGTRPTSPGSDRSNPTSTPRTSSRRSANLANELPVPLIGFAGAPFTVASYLIEGRPSRTYGLTKRLMLGDPELWHTLLDRLADIAIASLRSQVAAGRPSRAALRQLGRGARPARLPGVRPARVDEGVRCRRRPGAYPASTSA